MHGNSSFAERHKGCNGAQNLVPSMREPDKWDLLMGHYLGVDHVGHTYDVHSPHMASKLQQMSQHVDQVRCACKRSDDCLVPLKQ